MSDSPTQQPLQTPKLSLLATLALDAPNPTPVADMALQLEQHLVDLAKRVEQSDAALTAKLDTLTKRLDQLEKRSTR